MDFKNFTSSRGENEIKHLCSVWLSVVKISQILQAVKRDSVQKASSSVSKRSKNVSLSHLKSGSARYQEVFCVPSEAQASPSRTK